MGIFLFNPGFKESGIYLFLISEPQLNKKSFA